MGNDQHEMGLKKLEVIHVNESLLERVSGHQMNRERKGDGSESFWESLTNECFKTSGPGKLRFLDDLRWECNPALMTEN